MPPPILQTLFRKAPSIAPIAHRSVLAVTGSQAAEFLNGLFASPVRQPQRHQYSAILHPQGRVMYDVFVYATADGMLLEYDSRASEATPLLSYLRRHVLRSKVKLRSATDEYDVWAAWGSAVDREWETERQWHWARSGALEPLWPESSTWPWGNQDCIINDRRAVGMGRRLLVKKGDTPPERANHDILSSDDYTLHRILHGVPEGITDIVPMHAFPMESNLDIMGAVDFRKGCYVGQELTVRTYHTGVIRKRIMPVTIHDRGQPSSNLITLPMPANIDIKAVQANAERQGPRPRGTGKLLSTHNGVGLALLRLEHVAGVQKGDLGLELEVPNGESTSTYSASPWRPEWWPQEPAPAPTAE